MKYPAIAAAFYNTPLALTPEKAQEIKRFLDGKCIMGGLTRELAEDAAPLAGRKFDSGINYEAGPRDGVRMMGRVAVVSISGVLSQHMNLMAQMSGGTSYDLLGAQMDSLAADPGVKSILLDINSPGGSLPGLPETGEKIAAAAAKKKVVAVANSQAASAAYWLASQASEIVVTAAGDVGSIGIVAVHLDESKSQEMKGLTETVISSGKYKSELWSPLSEDAKAAIQERSDKLYAMFVKAVAKGRNVSAGKVESDFGQGRMVMGKDAVAAGMADRVATLQQTLVRLGADESAARGASASADRFKREAMARAAEVGA